MIGMAQAQRVAAVLETFERAGCAGTSTVELVARDLALSLVSIERALAALEIGDQHQAESILRSTFSEATS